MKTICFFVFGFPPDFSGATLQTLYLADYLKTRGMDSLFLTYTFRKENLNIREYNGYKIIRFLQLPTNKLLYYHCKFVFNLFLNRRKYSIIYINGNSGQFWTIFWATVFAKLFSKKIFVELNMDIPGVDPLSINGTKLECLKLFTAKRVEKFISNSIAITKNFKASYPEMNNVETIFYGININRFKKLDNIDDKYMLRDKLGLSQKPKIAVTCGQISRRKGIDFLLDCWEEINRQFNGDCLLIIVGPYKDLNEAHDEIFVNKILKRVESEQLNGKVCLAGKVDNVHEYMQASDLFLFTSRQEGSPSVIREAMSSSLPVVSLNLPDITSELIDNNNSGVIIELKDYGNLANFQNEEIKDLEAKKNFINNALKVMDDPSFADMLGKNARKKIENNYSFKIKTDKYLRLFNNT